MAFGRGKGSNFPFPIDLSRRRHSRQISDPAEYSLSCLQAAVLPFHERDVHMHHPDESLYNTRLNGIKWMSSDRKWTGR